MSNHINVARQKPFLEAAASGDLAAVQRYFQDPDARANVALWHAVDRATRLGLPAPAGSDQLPQPWYVGTRLGESLFDSHIVFNSQVEVFQWLFAREQLVLLGETLRRLVNDVLNTCLFAPNYAHVREMMEIVIASPLFQEEMDHQEQLTVLGTLLNTAASCGFHGWVDVLLAYGAEPNFFCAHETPMTAIAYQGNAKTLDLLLAHGAWVVGDELPTPSAWGRSDELVGELLRRGADANAVLSPHGSALHAAASRYSGTTVKRLIEDGVADVDVRDVNGCTPLMIVAQETHHNRRSSTPKQRVVQMLLDAGASIHAVDHKLRSVVYYALCGRSDACLRLVLEHGADPNHQDIHGQTAIAALLDETHDNVVGSVTELLSLLLHVGADPFLCDARGVSVAEILARSETGRAFVQANAAFFRHER